MDGRDRDYLAESEITAGLWVNDSLVVVSTLKGGVVFLNPYQKGKEQRNVQKVINHQNDLPDNEVFTLNIDDQGAVWVGHEKGFTRVAPDYPFRRYDRFPGLVGKIQNAYQHKDILYVGTDAAVYVSKDGGAVWDVLGDLPFAYVHDLQVHPRDNMIIIATHGRGMFVLDANAVNEKDKMRSPGW